MPCRGPGGPVGLRRIAPARSCRATGFDLSIDG